MKILALDPGLGVHFAWALMEDGSIKRTGILEAIDEITPDYFQTNCLKFRAQMASLIKELGLDPARDHIIAERFMARPGKSAGRSSEVINLSLGLIVSLQNSIPMAIIPASQWKVRLRSFSIGHNKKPSKAKKKKTGSRARKTRVVKLCDWDSTVEWLAHHYPESVSIKGRKNKVTLSIHEGDACGIALYWWEKLTGKFLLDSFWDSMHASRKNAK